MYLDRRRTAQRVEPPSYYTALLLLHTVAEFRDKRVATTHRLPLALDYESTRLRCGVERVPRAIFRSQAF